MAQVNPQAQEMTDMARGTLISKGASYDTALGFISSCHGVSCLAHYSLMPGEETVSRKACARELIKETGCDIEIDWIEACVEVFVNRHDELHSKQIYQIPDDIYNLLSNWENEFLQKLGEVDE